ncbi:MAG: Ig-like domain-containing protein [Rhodanobacteraceae bacterium]|nr:Ig-like domain-containing protein [Rhodanobacteraceae bacterium]
MYAQFQDEYAFIGEHKIDMRTRSSVRQFTTISNGVDTSQFALPLGNLLVTGGVGDPGQGWAIFAYQAAPDARPPSVAFHIPRAGQSGYPTGAPISLLIHETLDTLSIVNGQSFMVRPVTGPGTFGAPLAGRWTYAFDDVFTFQPNAPLAANQSYEVRLDGIRDAAGNAMAPYAFTFSTGLSVGGNRPPVVDAFSATPYPPHPARWSISPRRPAIPTATRCSTASTSATARRAPPGAATLAQRSYAQPGHYRASVQVRDSSGVIASRTRVVTVLAPLPAARPTASAPILCDGPNRRVWTVNPDGDTISALDADSPAEAGRARHLRRPARSRARQAVSCGWLAMTTTASASTTKSPARSSTPSTPATAARRLGWRCRRTARAPTWRSAAAASCAATAWATRAQTGALALGPNPRGLAVSADGARAGHALPCRRSTTARSGTSTPQR